jgi:hypothetical protein
MTGRSGFGMYIGLATIFYMPRSELYDSVPRRELWTLLGVLVLFVAACVALKFLVPNSTAKSVERVFRHPVIVLPMWILMMWGLHRHWKQQKPESQV